MEKAVVIGGGVGPMAGVALHAKLIENSLTDGTDQDHLRVVHLSFSPDLPDRTEYLLGRTAINPAEGMARAFRVAWRGLEAEGLEAVGGIPCNTFHAPSIMGAFRAALERDGVGIPVLDMLGETIALMREGLGGIESVGILSTTGTRKAGIWRSALEGAGLRAVEVPETEQETVHRAIYDREWGIKALSPPSHEARSRLLDMLGLLSSEGAQAVVLACTEIPLALPEPEIGGLRLVDPMLALARALIREAAPDKLKSL